jgi:hypothetical protein
MFCVEGEGENFVKQEPGVFVENTENQHFEYIDVTSMKTETGYITKEEHEECFEKLDFETVKEETEEEISVHENEVCLGDVEGSR